MKASEFIASALLLLTTCGIQAQPAGDGAKSPGDEPASGQIPELPTGSDPAVCRRADRASTEMPPFFGSGVHGGKHPPGKPPCFGALTAEERRALRRDILQAGQELYWQRPFRQHGGPPPSRRD